MRGAPQPGLLRLIIRIKSRTSRGTLGRPGLPRRIFHVQNNRKPFRCQETTVSALTIIRGDFQSAHIRRSAIQKKRSAGVNFSRFGAERRKTASGYRKAMFSNRSCADVLNIDAMAPNTAKSRCRAYQRNKWKSVIFNDYRSIRVFWRDN